MAELLSADARKQALGGIPGWTEVQDGKGIGKTFVFKDFNEAFGFMTRAALVAGLVVAGVPSLVVLWVWLRGRIAFVRRASSTRSLLALPGGDDLLALRALTGRDPKAALAVSPDPVAAWRTGEPDVVRRLADVALREAGVARR